MKALRIIAIVLGVLIAIIALIVILALTPAIQTWAVRKAVANQPGLKLDVSRVAAGFSATDLDNVHLVKDGMVITAKHVSARYSAWDYFSHKRINVDDLTVEDLVLDLRGAPTPERGQTTTTTAQASGNVTTTTTTSTTTTTAQQNQASQPFNGVLSQLKLPYDVRIARFSIPGRALLPNDQTATFDLRGSDISNGQQGTVDWKADLTNAAANAPFTALHTTGTAHVHITPDRRIDLADVNALASAEGPKLPPDQIKLEAKAQQLAPDGNEGYNATVSLVRGSAAEQLLNLAGQYNASTKEIAGAWTLNVRSEEVAALLTGLGLPDVAANGSGKFSAKPDTGAVTADGELNGVLSRLEKISPELAQIGSLHVQTRFAGSLANQVAQLENFALNATTANGRNLAEITALQHVGYSLADKRVTFANAQSDLARVSIQGLPLAWAQPFAKSVSIDGGDLSMVLAIAAAADGSHVRVTSVEPLALRNVTVRNGQQKLADGLTLTVKPQADYSSDHLRAELNDLAMSSATGDTVNGRFTADITHLSKSPTIAFTTDTRAKFVAMLKPYLKADTGPLTVSTKSEGTLTGQNLRFARSATKIAQQNGQPIVSVDLQQPLTFDMKTNAVTATNPDAEALHVALGKIPLVWAQGYVPNSKIDGEVTGGTIGVTIRSLDDLTANATEPIAIHGATVAMNNQPMLQNVDLSADFTAAKKGTTVAYNVRRVEAKQGATTLLTLIVAGDAKLEATPTITAKGTLTADLAALMQQPAAGASTLARGNLNASFDANIAKTIQANARLTASNLVAKQNNQSLGTAELLLTAAVQPDGSSELKVPFTLTNGARKSDLSLDGKLTRSANSVSFNGKITSNLLVVDDLQPLAALAPSSKPVAGTATTRPAVPAVSPTGAPPAPAEGPATAGTTRPTTATTPGAATVPATAGARDTQPFWTGAGGKIDVDLKQIKYGKDYVISGVRGGASITPTQLAVNSLQGSFSNNPFQLSATITFDGQQPQPYTLGAKADVNNFDVGAILQAANPNEKPQLETKVTVTANINGKGTNLSNLTQNAYGTFDLNGSKGVLRALGNKAGTAANLGSTLLGLAGAVQGSDTTTALADLTRKLAELPFDRFTMHVERGADLNLKVSRIEFVSPDTRITGSGGIQNQPGVPIQNQPMQFTLQLAGKDDMAVLLNRVKMLSGRQDDQGYYTMTRTFSVGGTPAKPDSSDLWKLLAQVGTNVVLPGVLKMFGH